MLVSLLALAVMAAASDVTVLSSVLFGLRTMAWYSVEAVDVLDAYYTEAIGDTTGVPRETA